jgi:tetratricopeptide (TPR) repeat protein
MVSMTDGATGKPESQLQACIAAGERSVAEHRWADAVKWFERATELTPNDTATAGKLAFALSRDQKFEQAVCVLQTVFAREPHAARWPYMIGYQYYAQSDWAQASSWFDKALAMQPDYIIALYRDGYAQLRLGNYVVAEEQFRRCIAAWESRNADARLEHQKSYSDACFQLGKLHLGAGTSFKARPLLTLAVQHDPDHPDKHYELGKCLLEVGEAEAAIEELTRAEALRPGADYVVDRLAQAYMAINDLAAAERWYQSIPEFRRREYVWRNVGILYYQQGRYAEAATSLRRAIAKEYTNHHSHFNLGLAYEALGRWNDARKAYSEALRLRQLRYSRDYPEAAKHLTAVEERLAADPVTSQDDTPPDDPTRGTLGVIESYNAQRGFGFIRSDAGERVFFHVTALPKGFDVQTGASVSFDAEPSSKGLRATRLQTVRQRA